MKHILNPTACHPERQRVRPEEQTRERLQPQEGLRGTERGEGRGQGIGPRKQTAQGDPGQRGCSDAANEALSPEEGLRSRP